MRNKGYEAQYHLMLLPGIVLLILFSVVPMFGIVIAFQDFKLGRGVWHSDWLGMENFTYLFELPESRQIFRNTVVIAVSKIVANLTVPLLFALLLNELRLLALKRWVQTIVYLPHFLSWVILSNILIDMLRLDGIVNSAIRLFGFEPIMFLASNRWFTPLVVFSDVWKDFGFNAIIYLAALTGIHPTLHEAAAIDGAGKLKRLRHVTLPGITPTVVLLATLGIGNVLNAGFDQIFNLYNPMVYETGDIIDTYVYRVGLVEAQFGLAAAVGLMKSAIAFALILVSYRLASKYANYRIF